MTDTTFGPEIAVNGKRPDWLGDDVLVRYLTHVAPAGDWNFNGWAGYQLPADHFAYKALDAGFEPWGGGDAAPADWDGGEILRRGGVAHRSDPWVAMYCSGQRWTHSEIHSFADIIGYHKRTPAAATPADTVTIARMTEAELHEAALAIAYDFRPGWRQAHRDLGLIRPETTAERFTRETGHEVTPAVEAALAWERGK